MGRCPLVKWLRRLRALTLASMGRSAAIAAQDLPAMVSSSIASRSGPEQQTRHRRSETAGYERPATSTLATEALAWMVVGPPRVVPAGCQGCLPVMSGWQFLSHHFRGSDLGRTGHSVDLVARHPTKVKHPWRSLLLGKCSHVRTKPSRRSGSLCAHSQCASQPWGLWYSSRSVERPQKKHVDDVARGHRRCAH